MSTMRLMGVVLKRVFLVQQCWSNMPSLLFVFLSLLTVNTSFVALAGNFTVTPTSIYVLEGSDFKLVCNYSDSAIFSWERIGTAPPSFTQVLQLSSTSSQVLISNARHGLHSGQYRCVANTTSTGHVEVSPTFNITINYLSGSTSIKVQGDHTIFSDNEYEVQVGTSITLQCSPPQGLPQPAISWAHTPITSESVQLPVNGTVLSIMSVQTEDSGFYTCNASNVAGFNLSMIELRVPDNHATSTPTSPTPNAMIPYDSQCGRIGGKVVLECTVVIGSTLSWRKGVIKIVNDSRMSILPSGALVITNIQPADGGQFRCTSSVDGERDHFDTVRLLLQCIQTVNVTSSGQQYKPFNKCFTLNCVVQQSINVMNVNYSIVWRHNGSVLTGGDRKVMSGTTLTVERALYEDSGNYTCTVEGSSVTPVSGNMNIIVEADPDIMVTTIPKRAMLNHTFTLTCSSSSIHDPEFKWYNGSFLLSKTDAGITIVAHGTSSTLTITHYMTSTSVLLCVSGDGLGRSNNVSTVVTLSNKLYLTREIGEQRVEERKGDQLQVECPIAGGIGDLMVRWYFGNTLLVNSTQYVINSRFLTFQSLNRTMDGQYRCVGKDSGLQVVSASFKLLITVPGYFKMHPASQDYPEGSKVTLSCMPGGNPLPIVHWLRGVTMIKNTTCCYLVYENGTLIIKKMTHELSGTYTCYFQQESSGGVVTVDPISIGVLSPTTSPTPTDDLILGFHVTEFIGMVLGGVGVLFLLLTLVLIFGVACYCCFCKRKVQKQNGAPKTSLETTSFDRRNSVRASLRKDNSGILAQSPSNASNLWTYTTDQPQNSGQHHQTTSLVSGSIAVSPGPPVPSPVPALIGPSGSLATEEEEEFSLSLPNFPRHNLKLGEVMGEGEFGPVLRGVARQLVRGEEHTEVAVKMLMRREGEELLTRNILTEFVNQMNLSSPNICTILGLCTDAEPYYIIYQYLDKGDLKQFLLESRPSPMSPPVLSPHQLKRIVQQVAHGMNYLYTQQIIHGDLATRNCLISSSLNVKIADLGIGHDLYSEDYYDNGSQLLPIRWMAPELLLVDSTDGPAFSLASDIWSYGVLCWEVFSYAQQPFSELSDEQVLRNVPRGHCLNRPEDGCPTLLYSLMQDCWSPDPYQRPQFNHISSALLNTDVD